jgi:hypothetical protein
MSLNRLLYCSIAALLVACGTGDGGMKATTDLQDSTADGGAEVVDLRAPDTNELNDQGMVELLPEDLSSDLEADILVDLDDQSDGSSCPGGCDDDDECTFDYCDDVSGCLHEEIADCCQGQTAYSQSFNEEESLTGVVIEALTPPYPDKPELTPLTWHYATDRFSSPPGSVHFGNPEVGGFYNGHRVAGTMTIPGVGLDSGYNQTLSFSLWMDIEEVIYSDYLTVQVVLEDQVIPVWTRSEFVEFKAWQQVDVDLTPFAGNEIDLVFAFDSWDEKENDGAGIYLDDVSVKRFCEPVIPCEGDLDCYVSYSCVGGLCADGDCQWNMAENCCLSPATCEDWDGCTIEKCQDNSCYWQDDPDPLCCNENSKCQDEDDKCTIDVCLNSYCSFLPSGAEGCCQTDSDCNDQDSCSKDFCLDQTCIHVNLCCVTDEECDDGDDKCTDDICLLGTCLFQATGNEGCCVEKIIDESFESGEAQSWILTSTAENTLIWEVSALDAFVGSMSLTAANEDFSGSVTIRAVLPVATIPPVAPMLEFYLKMQLADTGECDSNRFSVMFNDVELKVYCNTLTNWLKVEIPLNNQSGMSGELVFQFVADPDDNNVIYHVLVDKVRLTQQCCSTSEDCDDDDFCTADYCPGLNAFCQFEPIPDCCHNKYDCADEDPCTLDVCGDDHLCAYVGQCCQEDQDCDDGDEICTNDVCIDGFCAFLPSGAAGCCHEDVYLDGFEAAGLGGWETDSNQPAFTWHTTQAKAATGTSSLYFGNDVATAYGDDSEGIALSPPVDLPGAAGATLEFRAFYDTEGCCDKLAVSVVNEDDDATLLEQFGGSTADWVEKSYDLSEFQGQTIRIRLSFDADGSVSKTGMFVDDFAIRIQCCNADAECDDGNSCTIDTCPGEDSLCIHQPIENCCQIDLDCDDGDQCTDDWCNNGECAHKYICCELPDDCDDEDDVCTEDLCTDGFCDYVFTGEPGCCQAEVFVEDFESGTLDGYVLDNQDNESYWHVTDADAYDGGFSLAYTNVAGTAYSNNTYGSLVTPPMMIPQLGSQPRLEFHTHFETESCCDWWKLHIIAGDEQTELQQFKGSQPDWFKYTFDMLPYAGQEVQFRLEFDSDGSSTKLGVFIDDFQVIQTCCMVDEDCDDGNPCTEESCPGPNSVCIYEDVPGCCLFHPDCDDGDDCSWDVCADSVCEYINVCCQDDSDCDDNDQLCTTDTCLDGFCIFEMNQAPDCCSPMVFVEDFDLTQAVEWELVNESDQFGWYLSDSKAVTGDLSLYYGNGVVTDYGTSNQGDAISPPISLPAAPSAFVAFQIWTDTEEDYDEVEVHVLHGENTELLGEISGQGTGWELVQYDLSEYVGQTIQVRFRFDVDGSTSYTGVWIDQVRFEVTCCNEDDDCSDENPCTQEFCPGQNSMCVENWTPGCCNNKFDCEDGDPCTVDTCVDAVCENVDICCKSDDECDDGDDICTTDSCVNGACVYAPLPVGGCCTGLLYGNGFEDGVENWTIVNEQDDFTWHITDLEFNSGSQSLSFSNAAGNSYGENSFGYAESEPIHLTAYTQKPSLQFFAKYQTEECCDWWKVSVMVGEIENALQTVKGEEVNWKEFNYDLSPFAGETIRIRFTFDSDGSETYAGVAIDDLRILQSCCTVDGDCDDDNPCTVDSCPGSDSYCFHDWIEGCCLVDGECDDQDDCTYNVCNPDNECDYPPACCDNDSICDDGDDICTGDSCINGMCQYQYTFGPGCCFGELFFEGFEIEEPAGWEVTGNDDSIWHTTEDKAFHGSWSLAFNEPGGGSYSGGSEGTIVGPEVELPPDSPDPRLKFQTLYETEACCDSWKLYIVHDGQDELIEEFQGEQLEWIEMNYKLQEYAGQIIQVKMEFQCDGSVNKQGVFIDDLTIVQDCCSSDLDCDDENPCTTNFCPGANSECQYPGIPDCCLSDDECKDEDDCTLDVCTPEQICVNLNICCVADGDCDDGDDLCTDDTCENGTCAFTPTGADGCCNMPLFMDDFSSDLGWDYGSDWQRGVAMASDCGFDATEDPATDHTDSADNYLAGVFIGGCIPEVAHAWYFLTSPIIDAAGIAPLRLSYWRWLNSDYAPYTDNIVQVHNGIDWQTVWQSGDSPGVEDEEWTWQDFDISQFANNSLQIRFGYMVEDDDLWSESSWNIDDVRVYSLAEEACCYYDSDCEGFTTECIAGACL